MSAPTGGACQATIGAALAGFRTNYITIAGWIAAALAAEEGDETFVVTTYYNPFDGTGSPYEAPVDGALLGLDGVIDCAALTNPYNAGLNDIIACVGGATGAVTADVHPAFDGDALRLTHIAEADIHPNNRGHRAIADVVIEAAQ